MHSFQFHYDTKFSKGLLWIRIKAESEHAARTIFLQEVPGCVLLRKVFQEY